MTGAANRRRGQRAEVAVVNYLRNNGWPDARRYLSETATDLRIRGTMGTENEGGSGAGETAPSRGQHLCGGAVMAHDSTADRFWAKVDKTDPSGCWLWTAGTFRHGYGQFMTVKPKKVSAHRWAYEALVGPIPEGLVLDHLCRTPACVNPAHLEPVTMGENTRRGIAPTVANARAGECMAGHPRTAGNLYVHPGSGQQDCRACARARDRERIARLRADFAAGRIDRPHGKRSTYDKYGCRCDLCIAANTEHARRNR